MIYLMMCFWVIPFAANNSEQGDECAGLAEFDSGASVNYSFSNFSFKVISFSHLPCEHGSYVA